VNEFAPLLHKLDNLKQVFDGAGMDRALTEVGVKGKKVLLDQAQSWAGPDMRLSGWPRGGKLSAGFDVTSSGVVFKPRPYGLWIVGDRGRRQTTTPRRGKGMRKLAFPDGGVRSASKTNPISVGATRGHRVLTISKEQIEREAPKWLLDAVMAEAKRAWD